MSDSKTYNGDNLPDPELLGVCRTYGTPLTFTASFFAKAMITYNRSYERSYNGNCDFMPKNIQWSNSWQDTGDNMRHEFIFRQVGIDPNTNQVEYACDQNNQNAFNDKWNKFIQDIRDKMNKVTKINQKLLPDEICDKTIWIPDPDCPTKSIKQVTKGTRSGLETDKIEGSFTVSAYVNSLKANCSFL
jgi:hypothetical protein